VSSAGLTVPLSAIRRDLELSPRTGLGSERIDPERVEMFAALLRDEPGALPPLIVVGANEATTAQLREPDALLLADGIHRYAARELLGGDLIESVPVEVHRVAPGAAPEALAYDLGVETAAKAAKPLTRLERRHAIARLVNDPRKLADRAIARIVGCSPTTVGDVRRGGVQLGRTNGNRPRENKAGTGIDKLADRLVDALDQEGGSRALAVEIVGRYEPADLVLIYDRLRPVLVEIREAIVAVADSISETTATAEITM